MSTHKYNGVSPKLLLIFGSLPKFKSSFNANKLLAIIERYIGVQPFSFFELIPFLFVQNRYTGEVSEIKLPLIHLSLRLLFAIECCLPLW